jgi:hypothetical protein
MVQSQWEHLKMTPKWSRLCVAPLPRGVRRPTSNLLLCAFALLQALTCCVCDLLLTTSMVMVLGGYCYLD